MIDKYDHITLRKFYLAGMSKGFCMMKWVNEHQLDEEAEEGLMDEHHSMLPNEPHMSLLD